MSTRQSSQTSTQASNNPDLWEASSFSTAELQELFRHVSVYLRLSCVRDEASSSSTSTSTDADPALDVSAESASQANQNENQNENLNQSQNQNQSPDPRHPLSALGGMRSVEEVLGIGAAHGLIDAESACTALVLIQRYMAATRRAVPTAAMRPLLLVALLVANKMFSDQPFGNALYARLGALPLPALALLELHFLAALRFRLLVDPAKVARLVSGFHAELRAPPQPQPQPQPQPNWQQIQQIHQIHQIQQQQIQQIPIAHNFYASSSASSTSASSVSSASSASASFDTPMRDASPAVIVRPSSPAHPAASTWASYPVPSSARGASHPRVRLFTRPATPK